MTLYFLSNECLGTEVEGGDLTGGQTDENGVCGEGETCELMWGVSAMVFNLLFCGFSERYWSISKDGKNFLP